MTLQEVKARHAEIMLLFRVTYKHPYRDDIDPAYRELTQKMEDRLMVLRARMKELKGDRNA